MTRKLWRPALAALAFGAVLAGCAALDERQRAWIFQPSDRAWGHSAGMAEGMQAQWIDYTSHITGQPVRLHALWHAADPQTPGCGPVLLYLHGARWDVRGSASRIRRMQALGFSVLVVHGAEDRLIQPELGRRLFDAAAEPKAFVLVEGGSHHSTNAIGQEQYRAALPRLFGAQCFAATVATS